MFDASKIKLSDFSSNITPVQDYVKNNDAYHLEYNKYVPNSLIIDKIKHWLQNNNEKLIIRVFGASWCPDCRQHTAQLAKIADLLPSDKIDFATFGEIKVIAKYSRKEGGPKWKSPPSPKEINNPILEVDKIPAFFVFKKDGLCLGKIDEHPEKTDTIEGEINYFLDHIPSQLEKPLTEAEAHN
ncbi:MAG: thioredoxin family protein [Promethearchaeota archaeon]